MAQLLAPKDQWFVVHVLSGQENKVRDNIEKRVKTEEMSDVIFEVLVPTERVAEIGSGQHARANARTRRKGKTESQLRSWRNGEGGRWAVPKSKRHRGRNRSGPRQAPGFRHHLRPRHSGRVGILAGRERLTN